MAQPTAGHYYIVSCEPTPDGTTLAITYNGENDALTVTEFAGQDTQEWIIADYDGEAQSISPQAADSLQVCYKGSDQLTVLPANDYVWAISGENDEYTIQDGGYSVFWGLENAAEGQAVYLGAGGDIPLPCWQLIAA
ncbi:hypothetical protein OG21DRAFT_543730 [Imleria badia]|nr:hypothetical protein OG21DRAFT_543730 [Imleria badia]